MVEQCTVDEIRIAVCKPQAIEVKVEEKAINIVPHHRSVRKSPQLYMWFNIELCYSSSLIGYCTVYDILCKSVLLSVGGITMTGLTRYLVSLLQVFCNCTTVIYDERGQLYTAHSQLTAGGASLVVQHSEPVQLKDSGMISTMTVFYAYSSTGDQFALVQ